MFRKSTTVAFLSIFLALGFDFYSYVDAQASTCAATWAVWMNWYTCLGCGLGEGGPHLRVYNSGLPGDLGPVIGSESEEEREGWKYYVSYRSPSPSRIVPNPWPGEGGERELYYLVYRVPVSFPKGSSPPSPPFEIKNFTNVKFSGWGLENVFCDDDNDDNDDDDDDNDDDDECPDLNLTIRGTLLPARRGTARVSGDWCN